MPHHTPTDNHQTRIAERAQPLLGQRAPEIQLYGTLAQYPLALDLGARAASVEALNQILADTMVLRDLYKKHHWQVAGHTFYQLHLLFDKHYGEQSTLVDTLAERIQSLGGISVAMAHDVAEMTRIERPPRGREEVPVQLSRLLEAHEIIIKLYFPVNNSREWETPGKSSDTVRLLNQSLPEGVFPNVLHTLPEQ